MTKKISPLFTDEFLNELAKEISDLYGFPTIEQEDFEDSQTKQIDSDSY